MKTSTQRWIRLAPLLWIPLVLAVVNAAEDVAHANAIPVALESLCAGMVTWYLWALLVPVIAVIVKQNPLETTSWPRLLRAHLPGAVILGFTQYTVETLLYRLFAFPVGQAIIPIYSWKIILYVQISVALYALEYYRRSRNQQVKASQLQSRIAEVQLQNLKAQLHPPILFHKLHQLKESIDRDVEAADDDIVRLGDFLRATLTASGLSNIVHRSELEFIDRPVPFPRPPVSPRPPWKRLWLIVKIWTGINLFFLGRNLLGSWIMNRPMNWMITSLVLYAWYVWALFTPFVLWLASRFPLRKPHLMKKILLHAFGSGFFWLVMNVLFVIPPWIQSAGQAGFRELLIYNFGTFGFAIDLLMYWTIVGVWHVIDYYQRNRKEEIRTSLLEMELLRSQLQALQMQIHPHFLFNTLHSISELIHEDVSAAKRMLERLENFLKLTIENSGAQQVTLETELEFLRDYLDLQQIRLQDRLIVRMDIDKEAMHLLVPNLILQPIVENAIRYGIAPRMEPGSIEIHAQRKNGMLRLEVRDDGPGVPTAASVRMGVGLSNTQARLEQLYGNLQHLEIANGPDGGLMVRMDIPAETNGQIPAKLQGRL